MANQPYTVVLAEWVFSRDWFPEEDDLAHREFLPEEKMPHDLSPERAESFEILVHQWLIFDRPTCEHGKTPLQMYIDAKTKHHPVERAIFEGFKNGWVSAFEIRAIRPLEGLTLSDLVDGKEYEVDERRGTIGPRVGDVMFGRMLPIGDRFILAAGYGLMAKDDASSFRYFTERLRQQGSLPRLTVRDIAEMLFVTRSGQQQKWEVISRLDDFLKAKQYTIRTAVEIAEELGRLDEPSTFLNAVLQDVPIKKRKDAVELMSLLVDVRNAMLPPASERKAPGPIENAMVRDFLTRLQNDGVARRFSSPEEAVRDGKKSFQQYVSTPQKELDGRTPREVILEERKARGNQNRDISYTVQVFGVEDPEFEDISKRYFKALDFFKRGRYAKALALFENVLAENRGQIPEVWRMYCNASACAANLDQFEKAEQYLKKALEINPAYALAHENLKRLREHRNGPLQ